MSKCKLCNDVSVISGYCKYHFLDYFENTVKDTIKKFNLLNKDDKVIVGVSGGKDSLATLFVLKKLGFDVSGLAIDEGIKGYRENTLVDLRKFSKKHGISFKVVSFNNEFKVTLDKAIKKLSQNPCHTCGVLRRFLLNKYSKGYDVIATGHNLDDEAQAIMMNVFKAQTDLLTRLGPISGVKSNEGFTKRIKPLYFLKEKEVRAYTFLRGFNIGFHECPYTHSSFRSSVQDELNKYEITHQGTKLNIVNHFLSIKKDIIETYLSENSVNVCKICGEPASNDNCRTCQIINSLK